MVYVQVNDKIRRLNGYQIKISHTIRQKYQTLKRYNFLTYEILKLKIVNVKVHKLLKKERYPEKKLTLTKISYFLNFSLDTFSFYIFRIYKV